MGLTYLPQTRSLIVPCHGFRKPAQPMLNHDDPINRGLVGCWPLGIFLVNSNGLLPDIKGNHNSLATATGTRASHHGGVCQFFDKNSIESSAVSFPFLTSFSLSVWTLAQSFGFDDAYHAVISRGAIFENNTNYCLSLREAVSGSNYHLACYFRNGSTLQGTEIIVPSFTNAWKHIVITYGARTLNYYYNGVSVGSASTSSDPIDGGQLLRFSAPNSNTTGTDLIYGGGLDGIRIYNRALNPQEILRLYAEPYAGIVEQAPRWRVGKSASGPSFIPQRPLVVNQALNRAASW